MNETRIALKNLAAIELSRHIAARIGLKIQPRTEAAGRISKEAAGVLFTSQIGKLGLSIFGLIAHLF